MKTTELNKPYKAENEQVVTKAVIKAAEIFGLDQHTLGNILGLSASSVSALLGGTYRLCGKKKEFELGLEFIRLFRAVDSLTGGNDISNRSWIFTHNTELGGRPIDIIKTSSGLIETVSYVNMYRRKY